ncbi:acyl carrier protein [Actinosynnema sp. NPDC059335]|uniref:acyl carrier protein n=1 Tax=Actinosynnema sp. NPDC059335 TaxID=3346804 RepID=UPI0036712AD3
MDLATQVRDYVVTEFLSGEDVPDLTDDFDLIGNGVVDSLGLVRLISHISKTYGIPVDDIPLEPSNFRDIGHICSFIRRTATAVSA